MNLFVTARSSFLITAALSFGAGRKSAWGLRGVACQVDYGGSWGRRRLRVLRPTSFQTVFRRVFARMFLRIVRHYEESADSAMLRVDDCAVARREDFSRKGLWLEDRVAISRVFSLLFRRSSQSCRNDRE